MRKQGKLSCHFCSNSLLLEEMRSQAAGNMRHISELVFCFGCRTLSGGGSFLDIKIYPTKPNDSLKRLLNPRLAEFVTYYNLEAAGYSQCYMWMSVIFLYSTASVIRMSWDKRVISREVKYPDNRGE